MTLSAPRSSHGGHESCTWGNGGWTEYQDSPVKPSAPTAQPVPPQNSSPRRLRVGESFASRGGERDVVPCHLDAAHHRIGSGGLRSRSRPTFVMQFASRSYSSE
jgi:hypothetical protein